MSRIAAVLLLLTACATSTPGPPVGKPAPWNANAHASAPQVLLDEWAKAENRATCAPLTLATIRENATPRRANFSGGWAVAWDVPGLPGREPSGHSCATCGRGVFGIAGAGVTVGEDVPGFPHFEDYDGENWAGWALEGGTGPNWLAQLRVDDQQCLYYVWSFLGREHVEELVRSVRRAQR
jgi:hypothetical protein